MCIQWQRIREESCRKLLLEKKWARFEKARRNRLFWITWRSFRIVFVFFWFVCFNFYQICTSMWFEALHSSTRLITKNSSFQTTPPPQFSASLETTAFKSFSCLFWFLTHMSKPLLGFSLGGIIYWFLRIWLSWSFAHPGPHHSSSRCNSIIILVGSMFRGHILMTRYMQFTAEPHSIKEYQDYFLISMPIWGFPRNHDHFVCLLRFSCHY